MTHVVSGKAQASQYLAPVPPPTPAPPLSCTFILLGFTHPLPHPHPLASCPPKARSHTSIVLSLLSWRAQPAYCPSMHIISSATRAPPPGHFFPSPNTPLSCCHWYPGVQSLCTAPPLNTLSPPQLHTSIVLSLVSWRAKPAYCPPMYITSSATYRSRYREKSSVLV